MNNNINNQNNQGMNNTISSNNGELPVNNFNQAINQEQVNNIMNQGFNQNPMNSNINQGFNQFNDNTNWGMPMPDYTKNNNENTKMIILIAGIVLAVVATVIIAITLLPEKPTDGSSGSPVETPSAKATLTCTAKHAALGVYYDETYVYYINDGSATVKYITKTDLQKTQFNGGTPDEWAEQQIDAYEEECKSTPGCQFDYNHSKGKYLELIIIYGEEMIKDQVKGKTAQEIYNEQKAKHENGEVDYYNYTCTGNLNS